jgi:5-methylcytosine-specific restriction endonuclease McrA
MDKYMKKDRREQYKKYHAEHREKRNAQSRERHKKYHDEELEYKCKYREEHHEEILAYAREYTKKHQKEKKEYRDKNKKIINEKQRLFRINNPESSRASSKKYHIANKDKFRKYARDHYAQKMNAPGRGITLEEEKELFEQYGYRCVYCGSRERLELDHIIPLAIGGAHDIDNATVACRICNVTKGCRSLLQFLYYQSIHSQNPQYNKMIDAEERDYNLTEKAWSDV